MQKRQWMIYRNAINLLLIIIVLGFEQARADDNFGIVTGRVSEDISGLPVVGASVALLGTQRGAISDTLGNFTLTEVPVGSYSVSISSVGYESAVVSDIVVSPVKPVELSVRLNPSVTELGKTVTVRSGFFSRVSDAYTSTRVQSSEEIRRQSGSFEDVVRTAANLPGIAQVSGGRNDLLVRGGGPSENLYLVDGFEFKNINHFGTQGSAGGPLSYINLDFVDNTRFYSGGFGVRYGDRLSSALDIDLREGRRDRIGGNINLSAARFAAQAEGPIGDKGSFFFSARRSYLDLIFKSAGLEFVPEFWDFLFKGTYSLSEKDKFTILSVTALDDIKTFNDDAEDLYENSRRLLSDQKQIVNGFQWSRLIPNGALKFSLGQSYTTFNYRQNDSLLNPVFLNESIEREMYLKGESRFVLSPRTKLVVGGKYTSLGADGNIFLDTFTTTYGNTLFIDNQFNLSGRKLAGYTQLTRQIGQLSVTAGLRADYFNLLANTAVLSPRLALSYTPAERWTFSGSIGRYTQAPSVIWLAANTSNRDLEFIKARQYILGIDYLIDDDTRFTFETYYKRYRDVPASVEQEFLVLSNAGAGFGGSEENYTSFALDSLVSEGKGRAYGVELLIQKKFSESPYYGTLSLSYGKSEYAGVDGVFRSGAYDQRFIGNLLAGYVINREWELSARFRLYTGKPYTPFDEDGNQSPDAFHSVRLATNHSLDVRVDRRWYFKGWVLTTYLDVQNIYNREEADLPRYNARTGEIETDDQLGIFPVLGISTQF